MRKKLEQQQLTPWEEFLQKKKEKKKLRRCQKKQVRPSAGPSHIVLLLTSGCAPQEEEESSEEELPADVDLSDPFFAEELAETRERRSTTEPEHQGSPRRSSGVFTAEFLTLLFPQTQRKSKGRRRRRRRSRRLRSRSSCRSRRSEFICAAEPPGGSRRHQLLCSSRSR